MTFIKKHFVNIEIVLLAIMAILLISIHSNAQTFSYSDSLKIWWNVLDTLDGRSIAASVIGIRIYNNLDELVRPYTPMTQDSSGAYYYLLECPDTPSVYYYAINWTAQNKSYFIRLGRIKVISSTDSSTIDVSNSEVANGFFDKFDTHLWGDAQITLGEREQWLKNAGDSSSWATVSQVAHAVRDSLERENGFLKVIAYYLGASPDSATQILYPTGGVTPKDSVEIYIGRTNSVPGTKKARVIYYHTGSVIDSIHVTMF